MVKYFLIILIISNSLVGGILKKIYSSYNYKYEVGVDYPFSQTLKFQDELFLPPIELIFIMKPHRLFHLYISRWNRKHFQYMILQVYI